MRRIARLFMNGRSQAVRLPAEFRFEGKEVYIRKDPETGDVILSRRPGDWESFFRMVDASDVPDDFMKDRENDIEPDRELF
ncbi:MAG: antitoxin [Pseudomonadota bacterium]